MQIFYWIINQISNSMANTCLKFFLTLDGGICDCSGGSHCLLKCIDCASGSTWALSHGDLLIIDKKRSSEIIWISCCLSKFDDDGWAWWKWKHSKNCCVLWELLSKDLKLLFTSPESDVSWIFRAGGSLKWVISKRFLLSSRCGHFSFLHPENNHIWNVNSHLIRGDSLSFSLNVSINICSSRFSNGLTKSIQTINWSSSLRLIV